MQYRIYFVLLIIFAIAWSIYDFVEVLSEHVDLNQHIPFLMPSIFVVLAIMVRFSFAIGRNPKIDQ